MAIELTLVIRDHNAVTLVATLKKLLLQTLFSLERDDALAHQQNQEQLENLFEQVRNFMCGNFFTESAKDVFDNFQLERELVEQDVLGFFITNLDRLSVRVSRQLLQVFNHVITKYAYQTRCPLVEILEKNQFLMRRLCRYIRHRSDTVSTVAAEMLVACCEHISLARKLVDLPNPEDTTGTSTFYLRLLESVTGSTNLCQLANTFKFLQGLLLSHDEVAKYAFTRDLHPLIGAFNEILSGKCHYYARFKCLVLFGELIQSRKLQSLIRTYTTNQENFKLFFQWANNKHSSSEFKVEFIKIFEIFRLFFLNVSNLKNEEFKKFVDDNYLTVIKIIDRAEKVRSYSDLALMYPEYNDVRERINLMLGKVKNQRNSRKCRFSRSESSDSL